MTTENSQQSFRLGFLTAIEVPQRGFVGGLLVTNHFGRPLEFQCTAPLKPNRAQEILYGPTLLPYVLGDLIGRTLIEKVGVKPHLVLMERGDLLPLRDLVSIPVACIDDPQPETASGRPSPPAEETDPAAFAGAPSDADGAGAQSDSDGRTPIEPPPAESESPPEPRGGQCRFRLGRQMLRFHAAHSDDEAIAKRGAASVPADADLREPFDRVREALNETAKSGASR